MNNKNFYLFFVFILFLLCLEIHTKIFFNPYAPNFLLIYFAYILYTHKPFYQAIFCIMSIELVSFLQTGIVGLSSIILIPLSLHFKTIKKFLHIKIVAPCLSIFIYDILFELISSWCLSFPYLISNIIIHTIVNELLLLLLLTITPTPMENK